MTQISALPHKARLLRPVFPLLCCLKDYFRQLQTRRGDLIARIAPNDREVAWINSGMLPEREKRLLSTELVAGGSPASLGTRCRPRQ
jgi:hypothetical protein